MIKINDEIAQDLIVDHTDFKLTMPKNERVCAIVSGNFF